LRALPAADTLYDHRFRNLRMLDLLGELMAQEGTPPER
jgi:hypothetical protein